VSLTEKGRLERKTTSCISGEILLLINPPPGKKLREIESLHWTGTRKDGGWFAHGVHVAPTIAGKFLPVDYEICMTPDIWIRG
jgi:hypothetical protein